MGIMRYNPLKGNEGIGPTIEAVSSMVGDLLPGIKESLEAQGCTVTVHSTFTVVKYPKGSTRQELWPRDYNGRYRIVLPNGCELREVQPIDATLSGLYIVLSTVAHKEPE